MGASLQKPGYLYLGAQSMRSEVRLIFISRVASESSRQRSFEDRHTLRGGWNSVGRGSDHAGPQKIHENVFQGKVTLKWNSEGSGCKDRRGWRFIFFLLFHPSRLPVVSARVYDFWRYPIVWAWGEKNNKKKTNSGLLKQSDQVELRYCKRSPPGVSHFQGPHEHMRHSCATVETERGWVYETATDTSFHTRKLIWFLFSFFLHT